MHITNSKKITDSQPVKLYKETQLSLTTIYYFQVFNNKILHVTDDVVKGDWVIFDQAYQAELNFDQVYDFKYHENEMVLGKIK